MNAKRKDIDTAFLRARRALLLDHVFFGSLIMHLQPREDSDAQRGVWADGKSIGYNPDALEALVEKDLSASAGLLAKSVLQCALGHHVRRGNRSAEMWNKASDYVVNPEVLSTGLRLPEGALVDEQYTGKSVEQVYTILEQQQQQQEQQSQQKQQSDDGEQQDNGGDDGDQAQSQPQSGMGKDPTAGDDDREALSTGEVRDLPADEDDSLAGEAERAASEREWHITLQQALQSAQSRGDMPGSLKALIEKTLAQQIDWREQLRRWMQSRANEESTWAIPNRRFMSLGITLPTVRSTKMGAMVIGNDTSGSTAGAQGVFLSEMQAIIEDVQPQRTLYLQCDTRIVAEHELEVGEELPTAVHGFGGTDLRKLFERVEEHDDLQPSCMIVLTDLDTPFPAEEPPYPVLWVCVSAQVAPFGEVIYINQ